MSSIPSTFKADFQDVPIKNPRRKFVTKEQKALIIDLFKSITADQPMLTMKELYMVISKKIDVGQRTIRTTIANYKKKITHEMPMTKKSKQTFIQHLDDFDLSAVRHIVHGFWIRKEQPTGDKVLAAVNKDPTLGSFKRSNFYTLLHYLNFKFVKRGRHYALVESEDVVSLRCRYIEQVREFRVEGRPIYFVDETWVSAEDGDLSTGAADANGSVNHNNKTKGLIVIHIGSEDGFVNGGLLVFESKRGPANYHEEINGEIFFNWMKGVIPLLKPNAVIVMDDAPSHSVETERCPAFSWKKTFIENWLEQNGERLQNPVDKVRLMHTFDRIKSNNKHNVVDTFVIRKNMTLLRMPLNHSELNPIVLAWMSVKRYVKENNTTFKVSDVQKLIVEGVKQCIPEMWQDFVKRVIEQENRLWDIQFTIDKLMKNLELFTMMFAGNKSNSLAASNDDNCDNDNIGSAQLE